MRPFFIYNYLMKTITCYHDDCNTEFKNTDRDGILKDMLVHYQTIHPEHIPSLSQAQKDAWMAQFDKDWNAQ